MKDQFQIQNIFSKPPRPISNPPAASRSRRHPYSLLHTPFKFLKWLLVGGPPQIRISADELDNNRRRLALSVGVILLIILIVSGIFGLYRRREIVREARLASFSQRADWIISQADQLSQVSPSRAGELVREERLSLTAEIKKTKDKKLISSFNQIISALAEAERRVSRVETVAPELYLSLGLIRPDTSGRLVSAGQTGLGILSAGDVVLLVSMSGRSGEVIGGGDLIKNSIDLAVSADKVFVLNPDNIVEIDSDNKTSAVVVTDEDEVWQDPFRLSAFGGSLYVFDRSSSEIYKHSAIESGGYGSRRSWLAPGITPNLSGVIDMTIDGDIWLLHQDGRLDRFRRGAPAGFKLSGLPADQRAMSRVRIEPEGEWQAQAGLPDEIVSPQAISVPPDGSRVWILDASSRVVAFDKESGDYAGIWQFSGVNAADLAVSESSGKIFLLAGENIFMINL